MLSLWDALRVSSTRAPLDLTTYVSYIVPPMVCSVTAGLLAIKSAGQTSQIVRIVLWPIVTLLALRAAIGVDMSSGRPALKIINAFFCSSMFTISVRAFNFAFRKEPLVRHLRPANGAPSILLDALDLSVNSRGLGWNWSHGLHLPQDTRPANRIAFAFYNFFSAIWHAFVFCVLHRAILCFLGFRSTAEGSTIFDETLPPPLQYLRASIISTLVALTTYAPLHMLYELATISGVLLLQQDPAQWPPMFDAPWLSTSLIDFWGRRWHQQCRHTFLVLGGYPFSVFFGRTGLIIGAFLASAVLHDLFLLTIDPDAPSWRMFIGFGMMGPGVLAERAFYKVTGIKVGGFGGWVWTMTWLIVLGNGMVEGVARGGGLGNASPIDGFVPLRALVDRLVNGFDGWLHSL